MTKDEALKLALEAFNDLAAWNDGEVGSHMDEPYAAEVARRIITAIEEALAQPEQKTEMVGRITDNIKDMVLRQEVMLYTDKYLPIGTPVYTTPPQRKPLTDEEIRKANHHMVEGAYDYSFKQGVKWAEYKHSIKENT